jgi:hypothetical protein
MRARGSGPPWLPESTKSTSVWSTLTARFPSREGSSPREGPASPLRCGRRSPGGLGFGLQRPVESKARPDLPGSPGYGRDAALSEHRMPMRFAVPRIAGSGSLKVASPVRVRVSPSLGCTQLCDLLAFGACLQPLGSRRNGRRKGDGRRRQCRPRCRDVRSRVASSARARQQIRGERRWPDRCGTWIGYPPHAGRLTSSTCRSPRCDYGRGMAVAVWGTRTGRQETLETLDPAVPSAQFAEPSRSPRCFLLGRRTVGSLHPSSC